MMHYIDDKTDALIIAALRALDTQEANELAEALESDTWLVMAYDGPARGETP